MAPSILLVDDSAVTRRVIRNLLMQNFGDTVAYAEAASGVEAFDRAILSQPDVVVLDIAMPDMNGVEAARQITQNCPKSAVLAVSNYDVAPILPRFTQVGIRGFVPKASMASELRPAIEALLDGKTYFASRDRATPPETDEAHSSQS
jgi:DNA-binding NarL/FixJ family response regulator